MTTTKNILFGIVTIIVCCSCKTKQSNKLATDPGRKAKATGKITTLKSGDDIFKLICQNWKVEDAESPMTKDIYDRTQSGIPKYPGLCLLHDNNIVENPRGDIRLGKFVFEERKLTAKFQDGGTATYSISRALPEKLLLKRTENGKVTTLTLTGEGVGYVDAKDNPYHPLYNEWRIKPGRPEDEAALKTRLRQNMLFYEKYFQDHIDRDAASISFEGVPSCLKWFQGGITIQPEKKLDLNWIECFYSKADALKARDILEDALMKKHKWDSGITSWMEQLVPVLRSIQDSI